MQVVILAAGESTRTYPLTKTKPKPLLRVANQTIIERNLTQLQGLTKEVIIVIGYRQRMIRDYLGRSFGKLKLSFIEQKKRNGSGGALLCAQNKLKDKFLVLNGDDLYSQCDLKKLIKFRYALLAKEIDDPGRFGVLKVKGRKLLDFEEKPAKPKSNLVNTGAYIFDTKIFSHELQKSKRGELEIIDYIRFFISQGENFYWQKVSDFWFPITYPWSLFEPNHYFLNQLKTEIKGKVEKGAVIKGQVQIGKKTVIKSSAYLEGPILIGENCSIGPNCYLRPHATIGDNCHIGQAVELKNTIIGSNTNIAHLSYIGDSIIGKNVNFGAGTITANLRHDGKTIRSMIKGELVDSGLRKLGVICGDGVKAGINTSFYPGVKLDPGVATLPQEVVMRDKTIE
jgi:bifunctional UDP-N-acetylglucosamine pyrophosphorylase/glucosamine-1-phosphate N-acetyltransferase